MQKYRQIIKSLIPKKLYLFLTERRVALEQRSFYQQAVKDVALLSQGHIPLSVIEALKPELIGKRIIWQYWGQGFDAADIPFVVKVCFDSVDQYAKDYIVIRLCQDNVGEYIDMGNLIPMGAELRPAHYSDILRLALLIAYGGLWLDATILLSAPLPENIWKYDLSIYSRDEQAKYKNYWRSYFKYYWGWGRDYKVRLLNSVLCAKPQNTYLINLLSLIIHHINVHKEMSTYFMFQIYFEALKSSNSNMNIYTQDDTLPHILQIHIRGNENFPISVEEALRLCSVHKMTYYSESEEIQFRNIINRCGIIV